MNHTNITDTALNEYCRITGQTPGNPAWNRLREEFALAKFVKRRGGAELWRGRRPWRLRFIVFLETNALVLASVLPKSTYETAQPVARMVKLTTDDGVTEFEALDVIYEPGFERRVAFKVEAGWLIGRRGEKLDTVVGGLGYSKEPPDWAVAFL